MIDFSTVRQEIRSLILRRRDLQTLLGSVFAGLGIFLQNTLQGGLPVALSKVQEHIFAFYAIMLMVPSVVIALRLARLHGGLTLNGVLYARLMQEQDFTAKPGIKAAARLNYFGVSFLQFVLVNLIAGFATAIMLLALHLGPGISVGVALGVVLVGFVCFFTFHRRAARFALRRIEAGEVGKPSREEWEQHISNTLQDANHGLNADVAFVGLIVFSVFEMLSGLGQLKVQKGLDLDLKDIQTYGPMAYLTLMMFTGLMGLIAYLRVRVAIGKFSLLLDPSDRPFKALKLTDSLLGYLIIAFLFAVSIFLLLELMGGVSLEARLLVAGLTFLAAIAAEQATLVVSGRRFRGLEGEQGVRGSVGGR